MHVETGYWDYYLDCNNAAIDTVSPDEDQKKYIHYTKTKEWAESCGISNADAEIIADSASILDRSAYGPVIMWGWHFDGSFGRGEDSRMEHYSKCFNKAVKSWNSKKDNKTRALRTLGVGLHSAQDCFAHVDWSKRASIHWAWYDGEKNTKVFDMPEYDLKKLTKDDGEMKKGDFVATKVVFGYSDRYHKTESDTKAKIKKFMAAVNYQPENQRSN